MSTLAADFARELPGDLRRQHFTGLAPVPGSLKNRPAAYWPVHRLFIAELRLNYNNITLNDQSLCVVMRRYCLAPWFAMRLLRMLDPILHLQRRKLRLDKGAKTHFEYLSLFEKIVMLGKYITCLLYTSRCV